MSTNYGMSNRERFEQFGTPLLSLAPSDRFVLHQVNWQGIYEDPTDTADVSYFDTKAGDLGIQTSIRTYHDGVATRSGANSRTSLYSHLVTAFSRKLVPREGLEPGLGSVLQDFERRTSDISLHESALLIDGGEVLCRAGYFEGLSVVEVLIADRLATLVGPASFMQEPMTGKVLPGDSD